MALNKAIFKLVRFLYIVRSSECYVTYTQLFMALNKDMSIFDANHLHYSELFSDFYRCLFSYTCLYIRARQPPPIPREPHPRTFWRALVGYYPPTISILLVLLMIE